MSWVAFPNFSLRNGYDPSIILSQDIITARQDGKNIWLLQLGLLQTHGVSKSLAVPNVHIPSSTAPTTHLNETSIDGRLAWPKMSSADLIENWTDYLFILLQLSMNNFSAPAEKLFRRFWKMGSRNEFDVPNFKAFKTSGQKTMKCLSQK